MIKEREDGGDGSDGGEMGSKKIENSSFLLVGDVRVELFLKVIEKSKIYFDIYSSEISYLH